MPLAEGHIALVVASGALDGLIEAPGGNHVMRGISRKVEQLNEDLCKATISEDGLTMKVVEVHSETMDTRIRAVDASHTIFTFSMAPRTIEGCEREYELKVETVEECEGEDVVSLTRENGVDFVMARLNDEEDVRFCLDGGASGVLISGELASKLQLLRTAKTKHCVDANGQTTAHQEMIIGSLKLGRFVISNLRCMVHDNPGPGFDPLLGQSVSQAVRLQLLASGRDDHAVARQQRVKAVEPVEAPVSPPGPLMSM